MLLSLSILGCSGSSDPVPTEIPDDETPKPQDTGGFNFDTGRDTGVGETPENTLTFVQTGRWEMSPVGGPYTSVVGVLDVVEYQDGMVPPEDTGSGEEEEEEEEELLPEGTVCQVQFAMTGQAAEPTCPTCDFSFDFLFYVMDGDPIECRDPELPDHGETRRYAFDIDTKTVFYDYGNSGLWLEWWHGVRQGDKIFFDWEATVGWIPPEEEE